MKKIIIVCLLSVLFQVNSSASDKPELSQEINIASKIEKNSAKIGKSTQVVDSWVLSKEKPTFLDEAIWNVEGIHLKRLSGAEGTLSVYSRGLRSTDSILLFDGVKFRDPSDTQGSSAPMLQDILLTPDDTIEIVKGSSSSVSGSTSQGVLVNVNRPYLDKKLILSEEMGSLRRFKETVTLSDKSYRLDTIRLDTDRYSNTTLSGSFKVEADSWKVEPFFYHIESTAFLHDAPFILGGVSFKDSRSSDRRDNELALYGVKSEVKLSESFSLHNVTSFTDTDRRFIFGSFGSDGNFAGDDLTIDDYILVNHSDILTSSIGYKYESESLNISQVGIDQKIDASQSSGDIYGEERVQINDLSILLQARHNDSNGSKGAFTYDVSGTYPVGRFKLASHFGTGFRNAALYERYGAFLTPFGIFNIGNPELSPEKSYTVDWTVQYSDSLNTFGVIPFISHIDNPIVLQSSIYTNSEIDRHAKGIEAFYERYFGDVSYRLNYTYTTGESLLDIPKHELGNSLIYSKDKLSGNLRVAYTTSRQFATFNLDTFTADKVREDGGFVVGLGMNYKLYDNTEIFVNVANLLNRTYTDGGYSKNGIEAYAGVRISL